MTGKWLAAVSYVVAGLFFAVTPYFLVDSLASPSSLAQYAGGGFSSGVRWRRPSNSMHSPRATGAVCSPPSVSYAGSPA